MRLFDKNRKRNNNRQKRKNNKAFTFNVSGEIRLHADEIWPDGDAPDDPTVEDVLDSIEDNYGDPGSWLCDWDLETNLVVDIEEAKEEGKSSKQLVNVIEGIKNP